MRMKAVWFQVGATPGAVSEARAQVQRLGDLPEVVRLDVGVVLSELVTSSVLHAGLGDQDGIDVVLRREDERVVIEVDDHRGLCGGSGTHAAAYRPGEMGRRLLDAACDRWNAGAGRMIASVPLAVARRSTRDA
jgi:two-component sensor histidine kinase